MKNFSMIFLFIITIPLMISDQVTEMLGYSRLDRIWIFYSVCVIWAGAFMNVITGMFGLSPRDRIKIVSLTVVVFVISRIIMYLWSYWYVHWRQ